MNLYLHKKSVLVAVKLEKIVVQLRDYPLRVPSVQISYSSRRHVIFTLYCPS